MKKFLFTALVAISLVVFACNTPQPTPETTCDTTAVAPCDSVTDTIVVQ